jgi:hypothetical protein
MSLYKGSIVGYTKDGEPEKFFALLHDKFKYAADTPTCAADMARTSPRGNIRKLSTASKS